MIVAGEQLTSLSVSRTALVTIAANSSSPTLVRARRLRKFG